MAIFYSDEKITIHLGDALETLRTLKTSSVDLIITSPPYNKKGFVGAKSLSTATKEWAGRNIDYDVFDDNMPEPEYRKWQVDVLNECHRILTPDGSMFYNHRIRTKNHQSSHPIEWILQSKMIFRQQIVWNQTFSPNTAPVRYLPTTELLFWLTKRAKQPHFNRNSRFTAAHQTEVWEIPPLLNTPHPAPFPPELVYNILSGIDGNVKLLDPFMGCGTVLKVARQLGLQATGIEISRAYCEMAASSLHGTPNNGMQAKPNLGLISGTARQQSLF